MSSRDIETVEKSIFLSFSLQQQFFNLIWILRRMKKETKNRKALESQNLVAAVIQFLSTAQQLNIN